VAYTSQQLGGWSRKTESSTPAWATQKDSVSNYFLKLTKALCPFWNTFQPGNDVIKKWKSKSHSLFSEKTIAFWHSKKFKKKWRAIEVLQRNIPPTAKCTSTSKIVSYTIKVFRNLERLGTSFYVFHKLYFRKMKQKPTDLKVSYLVWGGGSGADHLPCMHSLWVVWSLALGKKGWKSDLGLMCALHFAHEFHSWKVFKNILETCYLRELCY
jgi:hypothetical protein